MKNPVCDNCGRPVDDHKVRDRFRCPGRNTVFELKDPNEELEYQQDPRCPHCRRTMTDAWDLFCTGFEHNGDEIEVSCGWCEKPYRVQLSVTIEYTTRKIG
jgi:DNA-directed RNA polymerase subunit RPC12/RpoP